MSQCDTGVYLVVISLQTATMWCILFKIGEANRDHPIPLDELGSYVKSVDLTDEFQVCKHANICILSKRFYQDIFC